MKKLVGITLMFSLFAAAAYAMLGQTGTWRYKLTLVVDDNGTLHTGSSVVQVHVDRSGFKLTPESTPSITVKGEATVVDLGEKGTLFCLLMNKEGPDHAYSVVFDVFPFSGGGTTSAGIQYYSHMKAKRDLPLVNFPLLVRFRDVKDPETVEEVNPSDLEKSFGPGVKLVQATIEMTDEPITVGIERYLIWLPSHYDVHFDGARYETIEAKNKLANRLASGAFSTELRSK